jgi:hypothetical protein
VTDEGKTPKTVFCAECGTWRALGLWRLHPGRLGAGTGAGSRDRLRPQEPPACVGTVEEMSHPPAVIYRHEVLAYGLVLFMWWMRERRPWK